MLGRYVVLDVLGEGGMGVVYAAYDPELDRKVAVKLLQAQAGGSSGTGEQAWLLREAQAMARVTHPNVISVFDVGTLPGDRVFVAMELVDGGTMRAWLKEAHPWREVVAVMRAAGAGLAAAHAAGLVHRDFKPDNVLVGKDGRVRVMDFGLARLRRDSETQTQPPQRDSDLSIESKSPLSAELTLAGHVVGTPAYMAPEIYQGYAADAGTDQFSFGVALYEALYRTRPFSKQSTVPKPPPADSRVPARVHQIVMRAISREPKQRFASMDELCAALAIDPAARRRKLEIAAGAVLLASAAGTAIWVATHRAGPHCEGAGQRLAGVWDVPAKQSVRAAFDATKRPYAAQMFGNVEHALDDYTREWTEAVTGACEATRVRGEQSEEVMTLREACLDQKLEDVGALVKVFANADADLVERADKVVFGLEPVNKCANVAALISPGLYPSEPRDKIERFHTKLAEARANLLAGHYLAALGSSKIAMDIGHELHSDAMAAEPMFLYASALYSSGNVEDGGPMLGAATIEAMKARHDELAAVAALSAAAAAADAGQIAEAKVWLAVSDASTQRSGSFRMLEGRREEIEGVIDVQGGDVKDGIAAHAKALAWAEQTFGKDAPVVWNEEEAYAATLSKAGRFREALPHFEHALALRKQAVGDDHPDIALLLTSMGVAYIETAQDDKAHDAYIRALAIRERLYGKNSPNVIVTLNNLADLMRQHGDLKDALPMIERARAIGEKFPGRDHPMFHTIETTYAETLTGLGRLAEARATFDALIDIEEKVKSPTLGTTLASRAQLAVVEKDWPAAASFAQRAIDSFEKSGGKDDAELWRPLTALGQARAAQGQIAEARAALEHAVSNGTEAKIKDSSLKPARDALAALPAR